MNNILLNLFLIINLMFFCSDYLLAFEGPKGGIRGIITAKASGESLYGVNIMLEGTKIGTTTDLNGKYGINNVPIGKYTLIISSIGYVTEKITNVEVTEKQVTVINVALTEKSVNLEEIITTANSLKNNETSLLAERKKASEIKDFISEEQIKRTPDVTSGDALKRITGLLLVDNKFIYIRGVTDRYNGTLIDGASVSSTETGKKSFSFDLLPSNLLENISVIKSVSPDLPGDFSGGLVKLHTLAFPNERIFKISVGSSFNTSTTGKLFSASQGSSSDWYGFDDGSRAMPTNFKPNDFNEMFRIAKNNWGVRNINAPLNTSLSLVYGNKNNFSESDDDKFQVGYILAFTYRNNYQHTARNINDVAVSRFSNGSKDERNILMGLLANMSLELGGANVISFKNNFNQSAIDEISQYTSNDSGTSLQNKFTVTNWTQRSIYTGQVTGEHRLTFLNDLSIKWQASISSSKREDPDRKESTFFRSIDDTTSPYSAAVNKRSWAKHNEKVYSLGSDFQFPIFDQKIKFGFLYEDKNTNYNIRFFDVIPDYFGGIPDSLTQLPLDIIYSPENIGPKKFLISETSKASDSYEGTQKLFATYIMSDNQFEFFSERFRFTGGVRIENSSQVVLVPKSLVNKSLVTRTDYQVYDILPSLNLTYLFNDNMNIRLAYSHSVNRPNLRELASTGFYDFIKYELVGGNPDLKRAYIRNYDIRLEYYPSPGEVFAISYFNKIITGAIEERLFQSSVRTRSWFNSSIATNSGIEIELRKSFDFIHRSLSDFSTIFNYSFVQSDVKVREIRGSSTTYEIVEFERPLQGQSPYTINLALLYSNYHSGTQVNLMFNRFGRRLETVGFQASDIYEEPRNILDLSISQSILKDLEIKFTAKNILDEEFRLTRDNITYLKYKTGVSYSLSLSIKF